MARHQGHVRRRRLMRILVRTSRTAIWARRLAGLSLPLAIVPVFLHYQRAIDSGRFQLVETIAFATAVLALLLSVLAMIRLWRSGDKGWDRAFTGLVLALVCLAPFGYAAYALYTNPAVTDVSTAPDDPLVLALAGAPDAPVLRAEVEAAFPNVRTRRYQLDTQRLFTLVSQLVDDRGWAVQTKRVPLGPLDRGEIDAVVTTWLGWRDEVGIRLVGGTDGVSVDMRSASLGGGYSDLGANGQRIEEFLLALDAAVTTDMQNGIQDVPDEPPPPRDPNVVYPADRPPGLRP
jgi:hypothetical protein